MNSTTYGLFAGALSFVDFALMVVFLVIALTSVKTKRPDAFLPFAISAALFLIDIVMRVVLNFAVSALVARTGADMYTGIAASTFLGFLVNLMAWVALLIGLVKLANDPPGAAPPLHLPPGGY